MHFKMALSWLGNGEFTTHPFLHPAAISICAEVHAYVIKFGGICTLAYCDNNGLFLCGGGHFR